MGGEKAVDPTAEPALASVAGALEALVLAAGRLGLRISADRLMRRRGQEQSPIGSEELMRIGSNAGLRMKQVRLTWQDLAKLGRAFPVILRLDDGHYMVAERFFTLGGETPVVMLLDPAHPEAPALAVDEVRLMQAWSGETLLLRRKVGGREEDQPFGFGWMMRQVLREKQLFRDIAIAASVMGLLNLVPPLFYMVVIDRVLVHHRLSTLAVLAGGIIFMILSDTALGYLRRTMVALTAARIDARVSLHLFDRLLGLPIDFFDHVATGLVAHKLGEAKRVRMFLTGQLFGGLLDGMTLFVLLPAMFLLNVTLATYVLLVAALMALVVLAYMGPIKRAYSKVVIAEQRKSSLMVETIQGMRTVKTLALEERKRGEWDTRVTEAVKAATDLQQLANQPQTLLAPLEKLIYAGSLCLGAYLAIVDQSAVFAGTLVAFTMIATRATSPIVQLAGMMQQFQEARGALAEVASVINRLPEPRNETGVRPAMKGAISFQDVRFSYPGQASPALDGISFDIEPGTVVGIMGRSGSGKTTVTRLLQGLHSTYQGLIKIDQVDMREIDIEHLRTNMGVVLQDSFLFSGTIRENILAGRPHASGAEMIGAARMAGAEEFIERLPRGYETVIEEGATNLSGGQRQRLAIARALVMNPPLIIFDEATSALDPDSEAIINANLRNIAAGRTVVMISHRLTSLVGCDQILVFERGRLRDSGPHAALLQRCDVYRHMWFQQNRHLASETPHEHARPGAVARG